MKLNLASHAMRYVSLAVVLVAVGTPTPADVITTGDVDPGGTGTQPDPWAAGAQLYVGRSDPGTLTVNAGGVVTNARGYLGYDSGATGEVTVNGNGSLWDSSERLYVGQSGYGSLGIEAGGRVTNMHGYLGYDSGGTGEATVTGTGSHWDASGRLRVGVSGSGSLDIRAGGLVTNTEGYLGYFPGSAGVVNVNTEGRWDNSVDLFVGGDNSGAGGGGHLIVTNNGLVTVLGTTKLWSTGRLYLDGGNLTTGSLDNSELGTLNFHNGTLTVNGAGGVFNPGSSSYSIDGNAAEDVPHVIIANTATTTLAGELTVGETHQGFLTVESAGVVNNTDGNLGYFADSTGTATVTGAGSQWNTLTGLLFVGRSGSGSLNVESAGVVTTAINGSIGHFSDSTGVATVTGADSQWNISHNLYLGYLGTGSLNVESAGVVNSGVSVIGLNSGSIGVATITGAGSQWNNTAIPGNVGSSTLTVGHSGSGSLTVEAGGMVASANSHIGRVPDSTGEATVTGSGSQWNNSGNLYIGGDHSPDAGGTGTFSVLNGGTLTVAGRTKIHAGSTFILEGGTFTTSILHLNGGSFTAPDLSGINAFDFDSGELNVTGPAGLTIGSSAPLDRLAMNAGDVLDVAHTLTIASGITATVNGGVFNVGGLTGAGNLSFTDSANFGLGKVTNSEGISFTGTLGVGPANLSLVDADGVDLGSSTTLAGGTLTSSTGFALDGDDDISGYGQLFGHLNLGTNGTVIGSGTGLELFGHVSGTGSISDTTIYGNVDVGNSVGQLTLTDVVIGSDNTMMNVEIGGADSSMHDTITLGGETTLAGSLEVELIDSFLPQVGDTFSLFSLEPDMSLQGDFNDILLPDLATGLWDTSGLLTSGNLLVISTIPNPCSWGGDASCNTDDLDALYAVFNTSVPPTDAQFDLNADNVIGEADLTEWLSLAATANGHSSPYLLGDTELDRDVDITDFNNLATHFDPNGATAPHSWTNGNFNGDSNVDITDFNLLSSNFAPDGYGTSAIPEPSALLLTLLSLMLLAGVQVR